MSVKKLASQLSILLFITPNIAIFRQFSINYYVLYKKSRRKAVLFTLNLHFLTGAYKVCRDMPFCIRLEAGRLVNSLYFKHADANCASAPFS
jgi:hypothetical protein